MNVHQLDGSNTLLLKFIYGPGIDEPICMIDVADSNAVYYYHFDGVGSVVALSDANAESIAGCSICTILTSFSGKPIESK